MEHSGDAETEAEDPAGEAERQWRQRTKIFNIHTREHPHDVETWWRFVCFQDQTPNLSGPSSVNSINTFVSYSANVEFDLPGYRKEVEYIGSGFTAQ